ncbi:MAG: Dabb family protein [Planctomycetota bacterium]
MHGLSKGTLVGALGLMFASVSVLSVRYVQAVDVPSATPPMLIHNVYFSLNDPSMASKQALIDACKKYLADQPGVIFFGCGTLADLSGPLNDRDYDVGLHMVFKSKMDLEKYETSDPHKQFLEENKASWKKVRVFDSEVRGPIPASR